MSKRPKADIHSLLTEGNFGKVRELRPSDPIAPTAMMLEPNRIKPYDRNPRRESNALYIEIKASIQARGLDAPLRITKRPGDEQYMIAAGGNTRLTIVQKLWTETGDARFERVHCVFTPWVSESDCLTAHLVENEMRADLVLIDKARALKELKDQLDAEEGKPISHREFVRRLAGFGYNLSRRQLSRYDYAINVLDPLIPEALRGDDALGGYQIDQIHDTETAYRVFYDGLPGDDRPPFDDLFREVLAEHDDPDFNLGAFRNDFDFRLSQVTGKPQNIVRMSADLAYRRGTGADDPAPADTAAESSPVSPEGLPPPPAGMATVDRVAVPDGSPVEPLDAAIETPPTRGGQRLDRIQATPVAAEGRVATDPPPPTGTDAPSETFVMSELAAALDGPQDKLPRSDDLKSLRSRCYVMAARFAGHFEMQSLVQPATQGHGFFLEIPPPKSTPGYGPDAMQDLGTRILLDEAYRGAWWALFIYSEMSLTPDRLALAPKSMHLPHVLRTDADTAATLLTERVFHTPSALQLPNLLLTAPNLKPAAFRDLLLLQEAIWRFKVHFREDEIWHCRTIEQHQSALMMQKFGGGRRHES